MHVDFKITIWERVTFDEEHNEAVLQAIKDGKINSANDLFNFIAEISGDMNVDCEKLDGTDEQMTPEENDGQSTIEVWEQGSSDVPSRASMGDVCIWDNSEK